MAGTTRDFGDDSGLNAVMLAAGATPAVGCDRGVVLAPHVGWGFRGCALNGVSPQSVRDSHGQLCGLPPQGSACNVNVRRTGHLSRGPRSERFNDSDSLLIGGSAALVAVTPWI